MGNGSRKPKSNGSSEFVSKFIRGTRVISRHDDGIGSREGLVLIVAMVTKGVMGVMRRMRVTYTRP